MSNVHHELTEDTYILTFDVGPNQHGIRLDAFLKNYYRRRSREQIKRAIEEGRVIVDRTQGAFYTLGRLKPSSQLLPGDKVMVVSERQPEPEVNFNYRILHEDEHFFIIDKPANLPVHPAGRFFFNTLLTHLKTKGHQDPMKAEREFYLVHRIDKETSGVLVLAKSREICAPLVEQFATRKTQKRYLAVVRGIPPESFSVDVPMARATRSKISLKMVPTPVEEGGLEAHTHFKRLEVAGDFTLVECFPKTGRQHQIRVHLDSAGHPIVGDKLYGMPESEALRFFDRETLSAEAWAKLLLPRHALHAAGIEFEHPLTKQRIQFESPLPEDLRAFLDEQKKSMLSTAKPTSSA